MHNDPNSRSGSKTSTFGKAAGLTAAACSLALLGSFAGLTVANAATTPINLGTAGTYSVLGGETITNTGPTTMPGDLGVHPGSAVTGFPPGIIGGTMHAADEPASLAKLDLTTAYNDAAGRPSTALVSNDLVGQTLVDGVYKADTTLELSGTLTLDGQGDPTSVFIFQVPSALTTASASNINLINGANACNIYWQVGSSATLGTSSSFKGNLMALTSISVTTGAIIEGRVLAQNGAVTLDNNTFVAPVCEEDIAPPEPAPTAPVPEPTEPTGPTPPPVAVGPEPSESPEPTTPSPEPTTPPVTTPSPVATPSPERTVPGVVPVEPAPIDSTIPGGTNRDTTTPETPSTPDISTVTPGEGSGDGESETETSTTNRGLNVQTAAK